MDRSHSLYFALETQKRGIDVEGPGWHPEKMGLSVAVTFAGEEVKSFQERDLAELMRVLRSADLVVGYNLAEFSFRVLRAYPEFKIAEIRYLDLLQEVEEAAHYRVGLSDLEEATTGVSGEHNGVLAVQLWKEGRIDELIEGCRSLVKRIKAMHEYGSRNGEVFYFKSEKQDRERLPVSWKV